VLHDLVVAPQEYVNMCSTRADWPLQDIANTSFVWCMVYKRGPGVRSCIAQSFSNSIEEFMMR